MSVYSSPYTEIECDKCGKSRSDDKHKSYYIEKLRAEGWKIGKYVTCPECAAKKEERNHDN